MDGATLFAKNSDRPPDEPQVIEWHPPRREATTRATHVELPGHDGPTLGFVGSRPTWMWGVEHGVNEAAVGAGNETIFTTLDPRPFPPALVGMDLVRLALERAASAAAAVEVITTLLERHGQGGSGHRDADRPYWSSFMVADPREAFVIETSGREWMVEAVDGARAISNRTTIPAFDAAHRHPRQPVETLVDPRLRASDALLDDAEPVDRHALVAHLRSHVGGDDGWTVCMHVPGVEATTASMVARLPAPADGPPAAWFLLGSPCRSLYVPVVVGAPVGGVPPWERFAQLRAADRAALDRLEAALDDRFASGAGPAWNAAAWSAVARALDALAVEQRPAPAS
ncbi:MAG: hypothetical protein JWN46_1871 [Acidimicrobiales bacterium]|nr:hypothetical protein [Acidimicrobiales bacterium]